MTAPVAELVEERIMADIEAVLRGISPSSTVGSFWTTVKGVHRMDRHPIDLPELPAIAVLYGESQDHGFDATEQISGTVYVDLNVHIFCVGQKDSPDWKRDIARFAADVKTALRIDTQRGQLDGQANAFDTIIGTTVISNQPDAFPVPMARVDVQVQYRHLFNDPTASI